MLTGGLAGRRTTATLALLAGKLAALLKRPLPCIHSHLELLRPLNGLVENPAQIRAMQLALVLFAVPPNQ